MIFLRRLRSDPRLAPPLIAALLAFVFLAAASPAQGQNIIHFSNSGTINYPRLGYDLVVDAAFPITITVAAGAEISSNDDPDDGYQSMEVFFQNQVDVTGGVFITEEGRPGGITAHDSSNVSIGGGSLDYVRLRDRSAAAFSSGMVGSLVAQDQAIAITYAGSLSSAITSGSSRMDIFGGVFGSEGLYGLENARVNVHGTQLQISGATLASFQGQEGVLYTLTGVLDSSAVLNTQFFDADGIIGEAAIHLRFNGVAPVGVNLPEADAGPLFALGLMLLSLFRLTALRRQGNHSSNAFAASS